MILHFVWNNGEYRTDEVLEFKQSHPVNTQTRYTAAGTTDTVFSRTTNQMILEIQLEVHGLEKINGLITAAQRGDDFFIYKDNQTLGIFRISGNIEANYAGSVVYPDRYNVILQFSKVVS